MRIPKQVIGEWFEPGFDGHLSLGATLGFIGQIQIFQTRFAVGGEDVTLQFRRQLVLLLNAFENGCATFFHFTQVTETFFQLTQLAVIQCAGDFLTVASDKGHGRAVIQQFNSRSHLLRTDVQFVGDATANRLKQHGYSYRLEYVCAV